MPDVFSFAKGESNMPKVITQETTYELTPQGKNEVRSLAGSSKEFMILGAIAEREPCSINEIRKLTKYSYKEIREVLSDLLRRRYVRVAGGRLADGAMQ